MIEKVVEELLTEKKLEIVLQFEGIVSQRQLP